MLQGLLGEAGADPAGEQEAIRALVADKHAKNISGTEVTDVSQPLPLAHF
jgi:hypothetical protein